MTTQRGSGRNEQKANQRRAAEARRDEVAARAALKQLESLPLYRRPADYDDLLKRQRSILKKAIGKSRKSENHSRKGKGPAK